MLKRVDTLVIIETMLAETFPICQFLVHEFLCLTDNIEIEMGEEL